MDKTGIFLVATLKEFPFVGQLIEAIQGFLYHMENIHMQESEEIVHSTLHALGEV